MSGARAKFSLCVLSFDFTPTERVDAGVLMYYLKCGFRTVTFQFLFHMFTAIMYWLNFCIYVVISVSSCLFEMKDKLRAMGHPAMDAVDREDSHAGCFSDSVGMQTYSLNTSLGAMHIMSRLNNEMSFVEDTASGSFGVVKKGVLDLDRQCYAVKQTKRVISGEGDLQQRLQEVYTLSACSHPNVLRYFDGWVEDRAVFVRTEWLSDGSVADFDRPFSEALLRSVIHQIASALHWLLCHHITHRDVKPENILARKMEDGTYTFKLADFGLARPLFRDRPNTGEEFRGTNDDDGDRRYLSPEAFAISEFSQQKGEADVYALGASCVELMGGDPSLVRNGCYTGNFHIYSAELQNLVQWMTRIDPQERPDAFMVALLTVDPALKSTKGFARRMAAIEGLRASVAELEKKVAEANATEKEEGGA
ncbi:protein kinase, putative,serine/threonine protein kinase, putative [Trypanosoma cruzi]|nr:protein kinase, putative,serine/threonine protein kinase, putative [Trypanosoma cruzi]